MQATLTNVNNSDLFNANDKVKFFEEMVNSGALSLETVPSYYRLFKDKNDYKIRYYEEKFGKDINLFTFEEMENVLKGFQAKNRNTVESYARIISSYLNWSVRTGRGIGYNVLADLKPNDFKKYLVAEESYFTYEELLDYEEACKNSQDAVILRLLFNGFGGKEMSEIRNLKMTDVDKERKTLYLVETLKADEDGNILEFIDRTKPIDDYTFELIKEAYGETTYMKKNGDAETGARGEVRPYTDLVQNSYVLRPSLTKTENGEKPMAKFVIHRRLNMLKKHFGIPQLTAKFIQRSGMLYYAKDLVDYESEEVSINVLKMVASQFKTGSYHNLKGIVTMENIKRTYPQQ